MGTMDTEVVKLKRRFGLPYCIAILAGFIIGSGIYIAPSGVLRQIASPGVAMVMWVVAAVIALLGGLTSAELGTTYPQTGDKYIFMQVFYGDVFGFMHLWQYLLFTRPGGNAIKCLVFAQYVLYPVYTHCDPHPLAISIIAAALATFVTGVNCYNITWAGKMQGVCASMTVLCLFIISVTGYIYLGQGYVGDLRKPFDSVETIDMGGLFLGLYSLVYAYGGWFALNYVVEEMKDPYKNLPRAFIISMCLVTVLYLSVNIAYLAVLGVEEIRNSDAVAMTFATKTLGRFSWVIALLIAIATGGSLNTGILVGSRLCFAAARQGHLPISLSLINLTSLSPITALLMQLILMIIMCFFGDIYILLNNFIFLNAAIDMMTAYGLLYRRYKEPDLHRPLKLPIVVPLCFALVQTVLVFGPLITKPYETGIGLVIVLATGIPYYCIFVLKIIPLNFLDKYNDSFTATLQKSLWCTPQENFTSEVPGRSRHS